MGVSSWQTRPPLGFIAFPVIKPAATSMTPREKSSVVGSMMFAMGDCMRRGFDRMRSRPPRGSKRVCRLDLDAVAGGEHDPVVLMS
ncbi:MAG: hypothetical protein IVW55_12290 [Chloroflexi bacterium]|nr:hypothetical protein [Chloroflexota bacterium]